MRSALLILVPLALLIGAFYFVVVRGRTVPTLEAVAAQSQPGPTTKKVVPATMAGTSGSDSFVGPSSNVWVESRNRRGKLTNKFRAETFSPRPDGAVDVVFPQAQFYADNGGIVTLEGSRGKVSLSQPGERSDPKAMGSSSPTAGDLEDVIIRFYDQTLNDEPTGEASMVMQLKKVHFDAIANSVVTVDCVIDGQGVLAERVPVTMRGRDFDFDGYGMTMRWNDRDGRLDSLQINRGERLVIKNVERFGLPDQALQQPAIETPKPSASMMSFSPESLLDGIVAVAPSKAPTNPPTTTPAPRPPQLYHATFDKDVRVMRDGKQLASGDIMRVIIPLGQAKAGRGEVAATAPSATTSTVAGPVVAPTTERADRANRPHRTATTKPGSETQTSTTQPTTAPAGPIEVFWNGPLIVRPAETVSEAPLGEMVELVGAPAWAEENGSRAEARLIHVERDAGKMRLEPGGTVKAIEVHDASGAELRSRSTLNVDRAAGFATVNGGGQLTMPSPTTRPTTQSTSMTQPVSTTQPAATTQPDITNVTWTRQMKVTLAGGEQSWIKQVVIEGEANVENKQLAVTSDALTLGFVEPAKRPPATQPSEMSMPKTDLSALRGVLATGDAKIITGTDEAKRSLGANRIELGFVAGGANSAALETVHCVEHVTLDDAKGFALACGNLDVKLKPTDISKPMQSDPADPLVNIDSMLATTAVALHQADGSSAAGERLEVLKVDGAKKMTLAGAPARVASARGGLEGANIFLDPASGDVNVPGPGRFTGTGDEKQPDSKMAIAWLESMKATGQTGVCDLIGGVKIDGSTAAGMHMKASAKTGQILFVPRPPAAATTGPAATSRPATRPKATAAAGGTSLDTIRAVHLGGDVDLAMTSLEIRTSSMQTQQLDIDWEHGMLNAPLPGRLMVIDGNGAATQPTTQPSTEPSTEPATLPTTETAVASTLTSRPTTQPGSKFPGSLAVAWQREMVWNMREGHLNFEGGTRLGFERDGTNDPIHMISDRLLCELAPLKAGGGADQMGQRLELHSITGQGNVSVRSKLASFDAASLKFDALTNRATATGDQFTPVEVFDAEQTSRVGFSAITWNVETGMIEDFRDVDTHIRR